MDILRAEIERKRKLLTDTNIITAEKKYYKGSELQRLHDASANSEEAESANAAVTEKPGDDPKQGSDHQILPRREVIKRLRDRGQPILLFGESELEAFQRLRSGEISEPEINRGLRNDFQEALEKVDQAYLDAIISSQDGNDKREDASVSDFNPQEIYDKIQEVAVKLGKGDSSLDMAVITEFLQLLLRMWKEHLNKLPKAEKIGVKGKLAFATYTQTQNYLKPLFKKLKNKSCPEDILDSLTIIVKHLLDRNYIEASDAYLQMAIGNAPWPIGVTMVGIHARTGREKIYSKNVAHVLNDETQRKYIQGLKRLMTRCQYFFPTDPSRCVEYMDGAELF